MGEEGEIVKITMITQDDVPETIALIRAAGVRVWMLTGDKYSTAVQIGIACNLIARGILSLFIYVTFSYLNFLIFCLILT